MKKLITTCLAVAFAGGAALAQEVVDPVSEQIPWKVCNETSFILRMAVATKDGEQMSAKGWQRLRPGVCAEIDAVPNKPRYVYAESSAAYQGGIREWTGKAPFCAGEDNFEIKSAEECQASDYEMRNYLTVDTSEEITRFVEPDNFSRRAETAGLQRLLKENGYRVSRIDGVAGRRTERTLSAFVKDKKLAANLTLAQQIDALEKAAIDRMSDIGVKICNKSSGRVWAAVGNRHKDDWVSRGWWSVDVGACIQPVTTPLIGTDMHIFARQEQLNAPDGASVDDKTLRSEAAEASQFCISDARFSARGREECRASGYEAESFRPMPVDKDGVTVNLTDADFAAKSRAGLRR